MVKYANPFALLGSMCEFSLNSFQLMIPSAEGLVAAAVAHDARYVAPSRRSTVELPPTRRASNPGATGAIHLPLAAATALARPSSRSS